MKNAHLLSLTDDEDLMSWIMGWLGTFLNQSNMSSLQAIHSLRGVITGSEKVREKVSSIQDKDEREEVLTWYCVYLYLFGIKKGTIRVVFG